MDEITTYLIIAGVLLLLIFGAIVVAVRKHNPKGRNGSFLDVATDVIDALV